jgi:hypothetical protein
METGRISEDGGDGGPALSAGSFGSFGGVVEAKITDFQISGAGVPRSADLQKNQRLNHVLEINLFRARKPILTDAIRQSIPNDFRYLST